MGLGVASGGCPGVVAAAGSVWPAAAMFACVCFSAGPAGPGAGDKEPVSSGRRHGPLYTRSDSERLAEHRPGSWSGWLALRRVGPAGGPGKAEVMCAPGGCAWSLVCPGCVPGCVCAWSVLWVCWLLGLCLLGLVWLVSFGGWGLGLWIVMGHALVGADGFVMCCCAALWGCVLWLCSFLLWW